MKNYWWSWSLLVFVYKKKGKCKKKIVKKSWNIAVLLLIFFQSGLDLKLVIELGNLKKNHPVTEWCLYNVQDPCKGPLKDDDDTYKKWRIITSEAPCWNIFWQWSWSFRIINSWCDCYVSKYFKTCIDFHTYSTFWGEIKFYPPIRNNKI